MAAPGRAGKGTRLLSEIGLLTILLSTAIIIVAEFVALDFITRTMVDDLKTRSVQTAAEIAGNLEEPLYILDDSQVLRIGQTLLSTGQVSGLRLTSSATGEILSVKSSEGASSIPSIDGSIRRGGLLLGTYHLDFSDREVKKARNEILFVTICVVVVVIASNMLAIRFIVLARVGRAFGPIFEGLRAISAGNYEVRIPHGRYADVNDLIMITNGMTAQIRAKSEALLIANQTLEASVAARTSELEKSLSELRLAQGRLVESERLSALGQLSAGMAHELNTPLGAILSSNRLVVEFFDRHLKELFALYLGLSEEEREFLFVLYEHSYDSGQMPDLSVSARRRRQALQAELERAGIGDAPELAEQLVELGVQNCTAELEPWLRSGRALPLMTRLEPLVIARRMVGIIDLAGTKAAAVISALRSYLSPTVGETSALVDVEDDLDKVLTLMHNLLKHGVTVKRSYGGIMIHGSAERLSQVWLNLLRNAAQAMDFKGEIEIRTALQGTMAFVSIVDSGPGVPDELREKIFDPFFTTKEPGEGMGLGLDVCRQIVKAHGGSIRLEYIDGRTTFTVELPNGVQKEKT